MVLSLKITKFLSLTSEHVIAAALVLVPAAALAAVAAAGLAPATQDHDLAAVPTPGPDLALALTARAQGEGLAPGQRPLIEQNAPASHVLSPKIKVMYLFLSVQVMFFW